MPSHALLSLTDALEEVADLQRANPSPSGAAPRLPAVTRAIGRGSVVLLPSHLERYVRNVNEEAITYLNSRQLAGSLIPSEFRLLHAKPVVEELAQTNWDQPARMSKLADFASSEMWLWTNVGTGEIEHARLLAWMKSPDPKRLNRYYGYWGIPNIFVAVTRKTNTRTELYLKVTELVEKRNAIAHGDMSTAATQADVRSYMAAVDTLCTRADAKLSRQIARLFSLDRPW